MFAITCRTLLAQRLIAGADDSREVVLPAQEDNREAPASIRLFPALALTPPRKTRGQIRQPLVNAAPAAKMLLSRSIPRR